MELKRTSWDERRGVYRFTHGHGNARIEVHVLVGTQRFGQQKAPGFSRRLG